MKKILTVVLVLFGFLGIATASDLTVGVNGGGTPTLPLFIARDTGFYKKEGLNIQLVPVEGTKSLQILLSGHINVVNSGLGQVMQANRQGADVRIVASFLNRLQYVLFSVPSVKNSRDLKATPPPNTSLSAGVVGVSTPGSESHIAASIAVEKLGLDRKDVLYIPMGENRKRLQALLAGYITATVLSEPAVTLARAQKQNALIDLIEEGVPWVTMGITVRRSYLDSNREILVKFLRATTRAVHFALSDERSAKSIIATTFKTSDSSMIDATYADFRRLIARDPEVPLAATENVIKQMVAMGLAGSRNPEDHVDSGLMRNLK